jgi:hypothetical protein
MSKIGPANAVRLAGALLFGVPALDIVLDHGAASVAHRIVASLGLALLAVSAAIDAAKAD